MLIKEGRKLKHDLSTWNQLQGQILIQVNEKSWSGERERESGWEKIDQEKEREKDLSEREKKK